MVARGLESIVAAATRISCILGSEGKLSYQGVDINDLADNSTFEETVYLLWNGVLPTWRQLQEFAQQLVANRNLPRPIMELLTTGCPKNAIPMDVLRTVISAMSMYDPDAGDNSVEANKRKSLRLTAQIPTVIAAFDRVRNGLDPISPNANLGHAANFLYMLTGKEPDPFAARVLDVCLILHADHGLNASTFAARVTASTLSDMHSAITSAIGTLKGLAHGGANEAVMRNLLKIGEVDKVEAWVRSELAAHHKIPGFGHRVYKTNDPRALRLRALSRQLAERTGNYKWYQMSERMSEVMWAERKIYMNVDFFSASVYYMLGIPIDLFTPIFAMSRIAGWIGHVMEQYADNRLIRPESEYVGPVDVRYVPIEQRK